MKPIIYISKRCSHCRKLIMMLQERPHLKGHYQITSIDDSPFPKEVRSVPCMIIDNQLVNAKELFEYILSSDQGKGPQQHQMQQGQHPQQQQQQQQQMQQQGQGQGQHQQKEQSCSVDELSGICSGGQCLDFAPIDDNDTSLMDGNYSFLNEPPQPSLGGGTSKSEQGSEKRNKMDGDYERLMAERGEMMQKPSFA